MEIGQLARKISRSIRLNEHKQIRRAIIIGFVMLGFFVIVTGAMGIYFVNNVLKVLNDVTDYSAPLVLHTENLIENLIHSKSLVREIQDIDDEYRIRQLIADFNEAGMVYKDSFQDVQNLIQDDSIKKNIQPAFDRYTQIQTNANEIFALNNTKQNINNKITLLRASMDGKRTVLLSQLESLVNQIEASQENSHQELNYTDMFVLDAIHTLQSRMIELQKKFLDYLLEENPDKLDQYEREAKIIIQQANIAVNDISSYSDVYGDYGSFDRVWSDWIDLYTGDNAFFAQYRSLRIVEFRITVLTEKLDAEIESVVLILESVTNIANAISEKADERDIVVSAPITMYITIAAAVALIIILGFIIVRFITTLALQIEKTMSRLELSDAELRKTNIELEKSINNVQMTNARLSREIEEREKYQADLERSKEQLSKLAGYLQKVREDERSLISREIHDELGQTLTALQIDAALASRELHGESDYIHEKLDSMSKLIHDMIQTVQKISGRLRPAMIDQLGLESAISWFINDFQKRTGIQCEVSLDCGMGIRDDILRITIFRIIQESLTNIARHAQASNISVVLENTGDFIKLTVMDDGVGISESQIKGADSFGLLGMEERVKSLNGDFEIHGTAGTGTTITVSIPIEEKSVI